MRGCIVGHFAHDPGRVHSGRFRSNWDSPPKRKNKDKKDREEQKKRGSQPEWAPTKIFMKYVDQQEQTHRSMRVDKK